MTPTLRPVFVQIVDRYNLPLLGARIEVHAADGSVASFTKKKNRPTRIEIDADRTVTIVARHRNLPEERRDVGVDARELVIRFDSEAFPTVLIVCALESEAAAVLAVCDYYDELPTAGGDGDPNIYQIGTYASSTGDIAATRSILLAIAGMGTQSAAVVTTHALRSFWTRIRHVIMVGIAGGCPSPAKPENHVRLGDIVAVNERGLIQYDYIKREVDGDEHRGSLQRPSAEMLNAARQLGVLANLRAGLPAWESRLNAVITHHPRFARPDDDVLHDGDLIVPHPVDPHRQAGRPKVIRGAIGTANILLKDPRLRDKVRDKFGVRAIEMEGSGVLDAGWAMNRDVMVVRGICDYCDEYKNDAWQPYAALCAAAYARGLVEAMPVELLRPTP